MDRHIDPRTLALYALGEPVGPTADRDHLTRCEHCTVELARLARAVEACRALSAADRDPPAPPERVWAGVAAEALADAPATSGSGVGVVAGEQPGPSGDDPDAPAASADAAHEPAASADAAHEPAASADAAHEPGASAGNRVESATSADAVVVGLPRRGPARRALLAAAGVAAAGLLAVGWLPGLLPGAEEAPGDVVTGGEDPATEAAEVVEVVRLNPLDPELEAAEATVHRDEAGHVLTIAPAALPAFDGYYEVWLIDTDVEGMVSLGPLDAERGHAVPAAIDLAAYPVVDVSREPHDGDPTHSGDSVLRGELGAG